MTPCNSFLIGPHAMITTCMQCKLENCKVVFYSFQSSDLEKPISLIKITEKKETFSLLEIIRKKNNTSFN